MLVGIKHLMRNHNVFHDCGLLSIQGFLPLHDQPVTTRTCLFFFFRTEGIHMFAFFFRNGILVQIDLYTKRGSTRDSQALLC